MHNPPANPQRCYNEARNLEIKALNYSEKPSNSKVQSAFPLATIYSKKTIFFEVEKGKGSRRQKKTFVSLIVIGGRKSVNNEANFLLTR